MDRSVFTRAFTKDAVPDWLCPTCRIGKLGLVPGMLSFKEGAASRADFNHPAWGPEWIQYRFSAMFECNNKGCGEFVSCTGTGGHNHFVYEDDVTGEEGEVNEEYFEPKVFVPPLVLMDIPEKCPDSVRARLTQSFALSFADAGAAMNAGRTAVEALLTELGIPRYTNNKGRRVAISLHHRIQRLPPRYAGPLGDLLIAVKWLGNSGSHDGDEPANEHVRLMYDLLEHCLAEIYDNKVKKLKAAAKKVNRKKGI